MKNYNHNQRLEYAKKSLTVLSVGDAFGDQFFGLPERINRMLHYRVVPGGIWQFSDDTVMAVGIFKTLKKECRFQNLTALKQ